MVKYMDRNRHQNLQIIGHQHPFRNREKICLEIWDFIGALQRKNYSKIYIKIYTKCIIK